MALNDIPLSGQTLDDTRDLIRNNFTAYINNQFLVDHKEFNSPNAGYHLKVTLLPPADSTIPAVPASGWVIFPAIPDKAFNQVGVAEYPITIATQELNIRKEGTVGIRPFTAANASGIGWTILPSGIILKWGSFNANPNAHATYTFPTGDTIPAFTTIFQVMLTPQMNDLAGTPNAFIAYGPGTKTTGIALFKTPTATAFEFVMGATSNAGALLIRYFAIGV